MTVNSMDRARALVGTRFRPQGRSPELGLDCIGLVLSAFDLPADQARRDYRIRGHHGSELIAELTKAFRRVPLMQKRAGDVLLLQVSSDQWHLAILTTDGFVHADARLGRITEASGLPPWPIVSAFRRRVREKRAG